MGLHAALHFPLGSELYFGGKDHYLDLGELIAERGKSETLFTKQRGILTQ